MSREVMKQALEALEAVHPYTDSLICYASTIEEHPPNAIDGKVGRAITTLRAALEEPQEKYTYGTPLLDAFLLAPKPGQLKDREEK